MSNFVKHHTMIVWQTLTDIIYAIEGHTTIAIYKNTFHRGHNSKWPPRSPQVTFKMGPLKWLFVSRIAVQNFILLPWNAPLSCYPAACCTRGFVVQATGPEVVSPSVFYGHNVIEVRCVGSGRASSTIRYYRKGHFCNQLFPPFNDTECVHDREPEPSRVAN